MTDPPGHLCVVLLSGLGDVVHGLPVVNALRDTYPKLRVTWVAEPMPAEFLRDHPAIDRLIVYHRRDGIRGIRRLRSDLKAGDPIDTTINLNVYFKSVWPTLLSGAPRRVGFDRARSFELVWLSANERLPARPRRHTADMFLEFAEHLGAETREPEWRIVFNENERRDQAEFFRRFQGMPVATVIPASASHKKDWMPERWAAVIDSLAADFGFRVVIAGGPGEREQKIAQEIVARSSAQVTVAMGDAVRRLAWVIEGSSLVLAPDTGPVHVARALNVPVIGIFGHTNPWRVGPWRAFEDLWVDHYTDAAAGPDPSNRTPKWNVMESITSAEVLTRVQHAVSRYRAGRVAPVTG